MINLLLSELIFVSTDARFDHKMRNDGCNTYDQATTCAIFTLTWFLSAKSMCLWCQCLKLIARPFHLYLHSSIFHYTLTIHFQVNHIAYHQLWSRQSFLARQRRRRRSRPHVHFASTSRRSPTVHSIRGYGSWTSILY